MELRPVVESDLERLNAIRNGARAFLHDNSHYSLADTIRWWDETSPRWWAITHSDYMIGYFRTSNWRKSVVTIGADIDEKYRNRGIAKEMYPIFMRMLIEDYGVEYFFLEVLEFNRHAYSLYKNLGFTEMFSQKSERGPESIRMGMSAITFKRIYG